MQKIDLGRIKKVYFIGIKGAGMAAVAKILQARGVEVSGSDTDEIFFTDQILRQSNIKFYEKFSLKNVPQYADLAVYSTAYNEANNVEFRAAKSMNLPMMSYPEILGGLFNKKMGLAVCGTHGKTTTSAMLAAALKNTNADPTAVIGSKVLEWKSSSLAGKGDFFVAEADEYQNKLKYYNPFAVILTSVDWDHPDYFPTFKKYKKVFSDFVAKIPRHGFLVVWGDSAVTNEVACSAQCEIIKYGFLEDNDVICVKSQIDKQKFSVKYSDKYLGEFETRLIGDHNILNITAVVAMCYKLNLDMEKVREAIKNFQGTARRFEYIGQRNGAILIDDYAHHPEEIKATLKAASEQYSEKNIITVFHPHTFTRTKVLLSEFSQSFNDADEIIIIDIYGSARESQGGVTSEDLVNLINKYDHYKAKHISTINETVEYLRDKIGPNNVVISMGAGDVWKVVDQLKQ
jgi:UDP-N-acetylmuramate--alanine ligase